MKLKCLIIDDESLARKLLEANISQFPFLELVETCKNPYEAMQALQEHDIDLMFLDIQMPAMLGTTFLQGLKQRPMVIFVTAYSNYAVESYELDVIDYLLKPVSMERFAKASYKALEYKQKEISSQEKSPNFIKTEETDTIFVNSDYALVKVNLNNVTHIESMKDYIKIFMSEGEKTIVTKSTLKGIEERLPAHKFQKVHKSFIVNVDKVQSVRNQNIIIGGHIIPVSDAHQDQLMKWLNTMRL